MKIDKNKNILLLFILLIIVCSIFYYVYRILYKTEETFGLQEYQEDEYKEVEHFENNEYQKYSNIIANGTFENGKDVGGYTDQSGYNKIIEMKNPSNSKYVLHQRDTQNLTYYEIIQPVTKNSTYVFVMWVHLKEPIATKPDFSKLLRIRILKENGANELPTIRSNIERESTLNSSEKWYLVKYTFSTSNDIKKNMNIYLNYSSDFIAKNIYYASLNLFKVLNDVSDFIFTNGLTTFISGLYCENGVISWRDLGVLGNNFSLKNRALVDAKEGFVNMYNNVATQQNGNQLFCTSPHFMINLLTLIDTKKMNDKDEFSICSILGNNDTPIIQCKVDKNNKITLQCNDIVNKRDISLILTNKTLLSIAFNNDTHKLILYQDCVPMITIDTCPTLYFEKSRFILNQNQYLEMRVYDCIVHNYILSDDELKELRTYVMDYSKRSSSAKRSVFDYIVPSFEPSKDSKKNNRNKEDDDEKEDKDDEKEDKDEKDDFVKIFKKGESVYSNVKKEEKKEKDDEKCKKTIEVKPSDCPTAYKKGDDYYIFIPKGSYYHNKIGYYGEKLYGTDKAKVRYIYQMNFPECKLPIILTETKNL